MKVRLLGDKKVANAKRFKDMSQEEVDDSVCDPENFDSEDIFIEPKAKIGVFWEYVSDEEVEVISE